MKVKNSLLVLAGLVLASVNLSAHCQVPCGIYADDVVFGELMTDVKTIHKAMNQINHTKICVQAVFVPKSMMKMLRQCLV